jgi:hypothetical protein
VEIKWGDEVLGLRVIDSDGRPLGRVGTAYCSSKPLALVWLVVRVSGLRRRFRAVPAFGACWNDHAGRVLRVRHRRSQVLASPIADDESLDTAHGRTRFEQFYAVTLQTAIATPIPGTSRSHPLVGRQKAER